MEINFTSEISADTTAYENLIRGIFDHVDDNREFNIIFVDNDRIRQINRDYRHIDKITDVISFALMIMMNAIILQRMSLEIFLSVLIEQLNKLQIMVTQWSVRLDF